MSEIPGGGEGAPTLPPLRERSVTSGGVRLHVVEAGPEDGPPVVLLHGFPEFWYGWRHQIAALAAAGYRVLVPDQRGYNTSDKPRRVSAYRIERLAEDAIAVIRSAGHERASVVAHDWGAVVGWVLGSHHPEHVERLAIINVPHPAVLRRHLLGNPRQIRRSWYIFFFQLPWLPEWALRRRGWDLATRALVATSRRGTFGAEDLARYREAWDQPGALRAMVSWYRAAIRGAWRSLEPSRVSVETLVLWGARDVALGFEMVEPSLRLCDRARLVVYEDATHWVQHERFAEVNEELLGFLGAPASDPGASEH